MPPSKAGNQGGLTVHYYKRDIGKYHKKAGKLSMLEHGAYTLLMDSCYDREINPTEEDAIDWCWARTTEEVDAVKFVLRKFFILEGGVYKQKTIEETLANYHKNAKTNKRIAEEREAKRRAGAQESKHEACTNGDEPPPNQELLITNNKLKTLTTKAVDDCPHENIISLYHEILPELPAIKKWSDKRKRMLKARWREEPKRQSLDWWKGYFEFIKQSDFLMGKVDAVNGRKPFMADLEWVINESNMIKIIEGKYEGQQ
jgi:uncharacterized protein YdaU (DUF1376 family)